MNSEIDKNARVTSDLPFGSEFSPSQINLPDLLGIVEQN